MIAAHLSDIPDPTAAERSLIRRAAVLTTELERLEAQFALADGADLRRWICMAAHQAIFEGCLKPLAYRGAARRSDQRLQTSSKRTGSGRSRRRECQRTGHACVGHRVP